MTYVRHMPQIDDGLVTAGEAATILQCDRRTVHRLVERGELQAVMKMPGLRGALVLDRKAVESLAMERAA